MTGTFERGFETIAHERRVVGDEHGLDAWSAGGHGRHERWNTHRDVSESRAKSVSARCRI